MGAVLRFTKFVIIFTIIAGSTSFLFTNCGEQVKLNASSSKMDSSSSEDSLVQTQAQQELSNTQNPFLQQKVQLDLKTAAQTLTDSNAAQKLGLKTKTGETLLPAGTRLIVVLYNNCENPSAWTQQIKQSEPTLQIPVQNYSWILPEDSSVESIQRLASSDSCVRGISNDGELSSEQFNDSLYAAQSGLKSIGHPAAMNFFNMTGIGAASRVVVAVIDSGVDYTHPDLTNNMLKDTNGKIIGYDYKNLDADPLDDFGHGTAVAGIIAAQSNNNIGTTGVMGTNIKILPIKVQDKNGNGLISDIVKAIDYSIASKVDVINISMAGEATSTALLDALQRAASANIFVAVAAGNSNVEISSMKVIIPAFYAASVSGAISVGSIDSGTSSRSSFSNYSATYVEIFAPGKGGIYYPCLAGTSGCTGAASYSSGQGTSYASPIVAGAAALTISFLKTQGVSYSAANIEGLLNRTAKSESALSYVGKEGRSLSLDRLAHYLKTGYSQSSSGGFDEY